jgi:hypothetical protein
MRLNYCFIDETDYNENPTELWIKDVDKCDLTPSDSAKQHAHVKNPNFTKLFEHHLGGVRGIDPRRNL